MKIARTNGTMTGRVYQSAAARATAAMIMIDTVTTGDESLDPGNRKVPVVVSRPAALPSSFRCSPVAVMPHRSLRDGPSGHRPTVVPGASVRPSDHPKSSCPDERTPYVMLISVITLSDNNLHHGMQLATDQGGCYCEDADPSGQRHPTGTGSSPSPACGCPRRIRSPT